MRKTEEQKQNARNNRKLKAQARHRARVEEFKRAQCHLGLRACQPGNAPDAVDTTQPVPYPFNESPVFIAIDVESHERSHNKITEIGIASLDTRDLVTLPPGQDGKDWFPRIRARHFRIEEHSHLVNYEFVVGCPDRFEFGTSEFISLTEARGKIAECFQAPFAQTRGLEYGDPDEDEDEGGISLQTEGSEARNIILVGHDINSDLTYLRRLNFNPLTQVPNILGTIDSATLYSAWRRDPQPTKLEKVLRDFDIRGYNLHNAGNDAVYTIQAMLAVCVRESMIRGGVEIGAAVPVEEEEEDDEDFVI